MKRDEYNEYRYRAAYVRKLNKENRKPIEIYIPVGASVEFKLKCLRLYSAWPLNCFIANVKPHPGQPGLYGECLILIPYDSYEHYMKCQTTEKLQRFYVAAHQ